jgi:hypothetical protein
MAYVAIDDLCYVRLVHARLSKEKKSNCIAGPAHTPLATRRSTRSMAMLRCCVRQNHAFLCLAFCLYIKTTRAASTLIVLLHSIAHSLLANFLRSSTESCVRDTRGSRMAPWLALLMLCIMSVAAAQQLPSNAVVISDDTPGVIHGKRNSKFTCADTRGQRPGCVATCPNRCRTKCLVLCPTCKTFCCKSSSSQLNCSLSQNELNKYNVI